MAKTTNDDTTPPSRNIKSAPLRTPDASKRQTMRKATQVQPKSSSVSDSVKMKHETTSPAPKPQLRAKPKVVSQASTHPKLQSKSQTVAPTIATKPNILQDNKEAQKALSASKSSKSAGIKTKPVSQIPVTEPIKKIDAKTNDAEGLSSTLQSLKAESQVPEAFRNLAKETLDKTKMAFATTHSVVADSHNTFDVLVDEANKSASEIKDKVFDVAHENLNRGFDFARDITKAKGLDQAFSLQQQYVQNNISALSNQVQEFQRLSSHFFSRTSQPIKDHVVKSLNRIQDFK